MPKGFQWIEINIEVKVARAEIELPGNQNDWNWSKDPTYNPNLYSYVTTHWPQLDQTARWEQGLSSLAWELSISYMHAKCSKETQFGRSTNSRSWAGLELNFASLILFIYIKVHCLFQLHIVYICLKIFTNDKSLLQMCPKCCTITESELALHL